MDPKVALYIEKMDVQVGKLNELVSDLLDVTRLESGTLKLRKQQFHLGELVKEVAESMQLTTDQHKIVCKGAGNVDVHSDKERIRQVLANLISNAIKYSPEADQVIVTMKVKKERVEVQVQDFGIGISEREQERVFDRFYRAEYLNSEAFPGLGLGLYISAEIIHRLDGEMWVKSEKGKGSIFGFELPL